MQIYKNNITNNIINYFFYSIIYVTLYSTKINIMKLLSMTDFVISQIKTDSTVNDSLKKDLADVRNYALFLKQPLTLGMFIPCDENGNVLNEPRNDFRGYEDYSKRLEAYEEAKEKVLFKGFEVEQSDESGEDIVCNYTVQDFPFNFSAWSIWSTKDTIEDMLNDGSTYPFELTESAIKQIFG